MLLLQAGAETIPGYRLVKPLGEGAYGEVWLAHAPGNAEVALKFIGLKGTGGFREWRALQWMKRIRHVHLLPIIGLWILDHHGNVVADISDQEKIDPKPSMFVVATPLGDYSLMDLLERFQERGMPGIPPDELVQYIEDAARGIDFLNSPRHDLGEGPIAVQHRDIKPDNILLIGGSAVVCDFGVSRVLHSQSLTATGMIGSPAYMAPECIEGNESIRHADQYSLALTYYHLRTGTLPFPPESNQFGVIHRHLQGSLILDQLPDREREVIARASCRDPQQRFDSCLEMTRALRLAVGELGTMAKSQPQPTYISSPIGSDTSKGEIVLDTAVPDAAPQASGNRPARDRQGNQPKKKILKDAKRKVIRSVGGLYTHRTSVAALVAVALVFLSLRNWPERVSENQVGPHSTTPSFLPTGDDLAPSEDNPVETNDSNSVSSAVELDTGPNLEAQDPAPSSDPVADSDSVVAEVESNTSAPAPPSIDTAPLGPSTDPFEEVPNEPESSNSAPAAASSDPVADSDSVVVEEESNTSTPAPPSINTNSIGMEFVYCRQGGFTMGSFETPEEIAQAFPGEEAESFLNEYPTRSVSISHPFYLSQYETRISDFRAFVLATGYKTEAETGRELTSATPAGHKHGYHWKNPGPSDAIADDHPVRYVSYRDAEAFCQWLSRKEGKTYRLPTQEEWEYACRAGTTTRFWNGNDPEKLTEIANVPDATLADSSPIYGDRRIRFFSGSKELPNDGWRFENCHDGCIVIGSRQNEQEHQRPLWSVEVLFRQPEHPTVPRGHVLVVNEDETEPMHVYSGEAMRTIAAKGKLVLPTEPNPGISGIRTRTSDGYAAVAPVGRFPSNGFALHDMHGNVWEWCQLGGSVAGADSTTQAVLRGGCFL